MPERGPRRFLGKRKWDDLLRRWEEDDKSIESDRLLEDQIRAALSLAKTQKATTALKWLAVTGTNPKILFEQWKLPWREDPEELVKALTAYITKHNSQYENNLIMLQATIEQQKSAEDDKHAEPFNIDDAIAGLNLAGFTINDPETLTIGQFRAMNKAISRNGGRKN